MARSELLSAVGALFLLFLCFSLTSASSLEDDASHEGYQILTLTPNNLTEVQLLHKYFPSMDVLSHVGSVPPGLPSDIMFSPEDVHQLRKLLPSLEYEVKVADVAEMLREHKRHLREAEDGWSHHRAKRDDSTTAAPSPNELFFASYRTYDRIIDFLELTLQPQFPDLIQVKKIGESIEKRPLKVYVLTNRNITTQKRHVFFNAGQHAREWLAVSSAVYSITKLLEGHKQNPRLLDGLEIHIVPVVNPDGYEFTHVGNRMWRKNRRKITGYTYGVDLNRNWPVGYGSGDPRYAHALSAPNSEVYKGTAPLSEPETLAVSTYIREHNQNQPSFRAHIDFHTYGRDILRRWASSGSVSPDDSIMKELGDAARDAVIAATTRPDSHGTRYHSERGSFLGLDGGCMPDWTYSEMGMISYTVELSDGDFVLPPVYIVPTGTEALTIIKTLCNFVLDGKADPEVMRWTQGVRPQ